MKWLAIRASEEDFRAALRSADLRMIEEGDAKTWAAFLERATSLEEPWGMVWLQGGPVAQLVESRDTAVLALAEGEAPVAIASDQRWLSSLVDMVTAQVAEKGGCLLDLREFGLSSDTVRLVAERTGLNVVIGLKAVFTPVGAGHGQEPWR